MVGLLAVAAALEEEQQRLVPGGLAGAEHRLDARADVGPDLGPDLPRPGGPAPTGTSRRACRGGRRRCRRTSARGPTPSTWQSARSAARGRLWPGRWAMLDRPERRRRPVDLQQVPTHLPEPARNSRRLSGAASAATPHSCADPACTTHHQPIIPSVRPRGLVTVYGYGPGRRLPVPGAMVQGYVRNARRYRRTAETSRRQHRPGRGVPAQLVRDARALAHRHPARGTWRAP